MNDDQIEFNDNPDGLGELQLEIGKWSRYNFGSQKSTVTAQIHGPLHPLMGMAEELGELVDAHSDAEKRDAVGDIAIYLCDYCCREFVTIPTLLERHPDGPRGLCPMDGIISSVGRLHRIALKHHQGIRGYDVAAFYKQERNHQIVRLYHYLDSFAMEHCEINIEYLIDEIYTNIVAKRHWKEDPKDGA